MTDAGGTEAGRDGVPAAALDSLRGLALGDGFGQRWSFREPREAAGMIRARRIPDEAPWHWTDDTAMALCVVRVLLRARAVDPEALAREFAAAYAADPGRGYGRGMHELLPRLASDPGGWEARARALFGGRGSLGNGAAMRVAPLGAWFAGDPQRAAAEAAASAAVTHAHPEGVAGAVAVAVAASLAAGGRGGAPAAPEDLLGETAGATPGGPVRDGLLAAAALPAGTPAHRASDVLGNGARVRASDTVPFALWSAAHHLDDLVPALWSTAEGLGDVDTTCAITGGVVAARTGLRAVPAAWRELCEPLPDPVDAPDGGAR
ncbi:ADP-ribosylglycohydrolase family protein [Streptomyces sp. DH37]|uniref:ADP-ribosylglycohydrolase family protein n=1 Tax=Streptomyces sp. DH37 TaxID=3040122 RepID=UPI00244347F3|nr:ADP-ribosylglycohydrolase family protein [Streptomyces sp. DH37]MDG9702269.1 ADP-ribosylglycohydrolase family protein [Streptomyces sp. DH37]